MTLEPINYENAVWNSVIEYAESCSWKAGPFLSKDMREHHFVNWERVFIAREKADIVGYCTLAQTDCIPDVTYTPYIGYMFVGESYRGKRLSQNLVQCALEYAKNLGFSKVYLVSGEQGLYEKYGFEKIEERKDIWGGNEQIFSISI